MINKRTILTIFIKFIYFNYSDLFGKVTYNTSKILKLLKNKVIIKHVSNRTNHQNLTGNIHFQFIHSQTQLNIYLKTMIEL